jgi:hypothetical protein
MSNFVEGIFKLGFAFIFMAVGVRLLNGVGKNVIPVLLAMGAAMLMIGAGIHMAATGFADLADAMSRLNPSQLQAFNTALMIFGVIFIALLVALGVLAYSGLGEAAVLIMLGFGAAMMMVGVGVYLAATGIGNMAAGFGLIFEAIDPVKLLAFQAFLGTLIGTAALMAVAATNLAVLAFGLGGLALALTFIKTADLQAIATFAENLGNIEASMLSLVADELERIAVAIDNIPTAKSILLTGMFKAGVIGPIGAGGGEGQQATPPPPAPIELHVAVHIGNEKLDEHIKEISSEEQESGIARVLSEAFRF